MGASSSAHAPPVETQVGSAPSVTGVGPETGTKPTPPAPAPASRARRSFGISLYHAWCKRCGICGAFCPTKALINDESGAPLVVAEEKCAGCLQCMHRCPDFCVEVYEKTANGAGERPRAASGSEGTVEPDRE